MHLIDPKALADLPFPTFLIALALSVAGLGWRQVWVWGRELSKSEKECDDWKAVATKMTETNVVQAAQITQLAESVALLTSLVKR
jgi:hypothetical protein